MQVAIVTGASSGIGFACATTLAAQGMAVLGTGRDTDRLAALEEAVGSDRLATVAVDLTEDDAPQRIVTAALQRWGRIDYLINNAGIGSPKPLHETDDDTLDRFLASCCGRRSGSPATRSRTWGPARRSSMSPPRSPWWAVCAAAPTRPPRAG